jgi:hypothetical protein
MVTLGRRLLVGGVVATLVALAGVSAARSQAAATAACGATSATTVLADEETTAKGIYLGENASAEVTADATHVQNSTALVRAVADNNKAATLAATTRLVITRGWHIVRLRVLSSSGAVLADVGGPYVIAPVTGKLMSHGTVVGSYVMSVQDDIGYARLVTRFTKLPIELYRNGTRLMGRSFPHQEVPAKVPPNGTSITVNGHPSVTVAFTANAFPSGTLEVLLAVPKPSVALAKDSCATVNATTYGEIAEHIAARFRFPGQYSSFVTLDNNFGPKLIFVRSGSTQLAGTLAKGPASIPWSGNLAYAGQSWDVFSFVALAPARIYLLFAPYVAPSGTTGASGASGTTGTTGTT